jgi:hypothetical protein
LARKIRDAEAQSQDAAYETSVNGLLGELLKDFNSRDAAGMRQLLDEIKEQLGTAIGGTVDLVFGGSVSRHTYLEGLSDTDALVILDPDDVGRKSPSQLRDRFAQSLKHVFGEKNVAVGDLAVTVVHKGKELQLLPVMRDGDGYRFSTSDGRSWSTINPRAFAEKLTAANRAQEGKLIPTIKIAKAMIAGLPKQQQLTGYHIESLAIAAFKNYDGPRTYKAMVAYFFSRASSLVKEPIRDSTGQSVHTDEYLGEPNSSQRRIASQALERVHRKLTNADASKDTASWSDLITGE